MQAEELLRFNRLTKVSINVSSWLALWVLTVNIVSRIDSNIGYLSITTLIKELTLSEVFAFNHAISTSLFTTLISFLLVLLSNTIRTALVKLTLWEIRDIYDKGTNINIDKDTPTSALICTSSDLI